MVKAPAYTYFTYTKMWIPVISKELTHEGKGHRNIIDLYDVAINKRV